MGFIFDIKSVSRDELSLVASDGLATVKSLRQEDHSAATALKRQSVVVGETGSLRRV